LYASKQIEKYGYWAKLVANLSKTGGNIRSGNTNNHPKYTLELLGYKLKILETLT